MIKGLFILLKIPIKSVLVDIRPTETVAAIRRITKIINLMSFIS